MSFSVGREGGSAGGRAYVVVVTCVGAIWFGFVFSGFYRLGLHGETRVASLKHVELASADWTGKCTSIFIVLLLLLLEVYVCWFLLFLPIGFTWWNSCCVSEACWTGNCGLETVPPFIVLLLILLLLEVYVCWLLDLPCYARCGVVMNMWGCHLISFKHVCWCCLLFLWSARNHMPVMRD